MTRSKADRRDAKRRNRREARSTGQATTRYFGGPEALHRAKLRSAIYRSAVKRIRIA